MRNYTSLDLILFNKLASENKDLKPVELIKLYNEKYPSLSEKEESVNLAKALGFFAKPV